MVTPLLLALAQEIAVFAVLAFVISRTGLFTTFFSGPQRLRAKVLLALGAGALGIAGTYWGIPVHGALANARVIGVMIAGLYGGPAVGTAAGLIAGVHRYNLGGFTALACCVSTVTEGLLAGLIRKWRGDRPITAMTALSATLVAESLQMLIILALARPFGAALGLVEVIALPMILANALGVGLMVFITRDAQEQREKVGAHQAHQALQIARQTLPHLREGLSMESAMAACQIILAGSQTEAVSITDRGQILAYVGRGSDHHEVGARPRIQATWDVLTDGQPRIISSAAEIGCSEPKCPLTAGIAVPLRDGQQVVGTLHLYQTSAGPVSPVVVELGLGLGQLFSTQLEISRANATARLLTQAELRALHAQIHPHFLFNALNAIAAICRRDSERARELLVLLSQYLRSSIRAPDSMVTLGEELEVVVAYLAIEKARFGDRLRSQINVPAELISLKVPILSIQPLVENSIRHGLMPRADGGTVNIGASIDGESLLLEVTDDGVGIKSSPHATDDGNGIALQNIRDRLRHLYGSEGSLTLGSAPDGGTTALLKLPAQIKHR